MIKGDYEWVKLPDRGPRGSPQNYDRVRLLAISGKAICRPDGWYVRIKKEGCIDKRSL